MTDTTDGKRDFLISFNKADRSWATWIAWVLEEKGYSVFFQDWDFKGNFVLEMDRAHQQSRRTLAILSPDYFTSCFTAPEWAARFKEDAKSEHDLLIPVRVRECKPPGLLGPIGYVDLVGLARDQARRQLLDRIAGIRLKPDEEPVYPGGPLPAAARSIPSEPRFPIATHNLPPLNPNFVGRENVLAAIREALTKGAPSAIARAYAITGLGGVGKTQTALAYCYHHLADYRLIWWVRAAEPATLAADFMALAGPLGLPEEQDQAKAVQAVKAKLQDTPDWLLVLDNAADPATVRPYLPGTNGHALLTSRRTDWQNTAAQGILDVLSESEANRLLAGRPDPDTLSTAELAEAKALAKDLGSLPSALAQARAYMDETGETLADYRELLRTSWPAVLAEGRAHPDDYSKPVARTWDLSLRAAEQLCPAARPLLELLAFFAPDALPHEAFDAEAEALPEGLCDKLARNRAISALHRFSLLRAEAGTLTVHRLVQAVTRDGLDAATAKARVGAAVRLVRAALPRPPGEHTNWPAIGALLPHALATAEAAERLEAGLETAATVLNDIALYCSARATYAEAEPLYQRALEIREKVLGPEHPEVATSLDNLAALYRAQGRLAEAEPLYQRALKIREKVPMPNNHRTQHRRKSAHIIIHSCAVASVVAAYNWSEYPISYSGHPFEVGLDKPGVDTLVLTAITIAMVTLLGVLFKYKTIVSCVMGMAAIPINFVFGVNLARVLTVITPGVRNAVITFILQEATGWAFFYFFDKGLGNDKDP